MAIVNKTGFEVYTEVEDIVANLEGYIDALCLLDNDFCLDNNTLSEIESYRICANHKVIRNIHLIVEDGLREIMKKINAMTIKKEDSDSEPNESAN